MTAIWPLFDLRVTTPLLTLRYVDDASGEQLADLATRGIHDPATMPFSEPWTDAKSPDLQCNTMRYYWQCRAETAVDKWTLNLAVSDNEGQPMGVCTLSATQFPTVRAATTGSWLGRQFQGRGLGREMRHAALHLLFDGFDGHTARTRAWHDNAPSLGVTRSLPYTEAGRVQERRRSALDTMIEFEMNRLRWNNIRRNDITLGGIDQVRKFLQI